MGLPIIVLGLFIGGLIVGYYPFPFFFSAVSPASKNLAVDFGIDHVMDHVEDGDVYFRAHGYGPALVEYEAGLSELMAFLDYEISSFDPDRRLLARYERTRVVTEFKRSLARLGVALAESANSSP